MAANRSFFTRLTDERYGWREEANDLLRGTTGGLIFGVPLLYTMEMWHSGMTFSPRHMLTLIGVIGLVNFIFSLISGLRSENQHHSLSYALSDAVTSVGLSLVISAVVLFLIGRLQTDAGYSQIVGKVLVEALVISIGIAFTNNRFEANKDRDAGSEEQPSRESRTPSTEENERRQFRADLIESAGTLGGAMVFSMTVAPTEEILELAISLQPWQQLLLLAAEFVFCYLILVASAMTKLEVHVKDSFFQRPISETLMTHALALVVSASLLWLVGFPGVVSDIGIFVSSTIVLCLPAVVGGAAGRLAV